MSTMFWLIVASYATLCSSQLVYHNITRAVARGALCNDFTTAGYFLRRNSSSSKWLIYLEGGGGCLSVSACNERFIDYRIRWDYTETRNDEAVVDVQRAWDDYRGHEKDVTSRLMTSLWGYSPTPDNPNEDWVIKGTDILSNSPYQNPIFHSYNHVLIPYCSSDSWIGMSDNYHLAKGDNFTFVFQPNCKENQFTFRGRAIFRSVIQDLKDHHGFGQPELVVLSGSSAGGVGVLNNAQWMEQQIEEGELRTIIDSSWFINFHDIINEQYTMEAINILGLTDYDPCSDTTFGFPCCISAACMLSNEYYPDIPTFIITSIYDLYLLTDSLREFPEQQRFLDILRVTAEYGGEMNHSLILTAEMMDQLSYIAVSCFQHVYLATSTLWGNADSIYGDALVEGTVDDKLFGHKIGEGIWRSMTLNSHDGSEYKTIEAAIDMWMTNDTSIRWRDGCPSPHCNPECPEVITLTALSTMWNTQYLFAVILSVFALSIVCFTVVAILTVYRCYLKKVQDRFMEDLACDPYKDEILDLPKNNTAISVACLNLYYSVFVSKATMKQAQACTTSSRNRLMSIAAIVNDSNNNNKVTNRRLTGFAHRKPANESDDSSDPEDDISIDPLASSQMAAALREFRQKREEKKNSRSCCGLCKSSDERMKQIICGVSTCFNPGQLIAIMGPSGCGKTTLLDLLTGRKNSGKQKGIICVNGTPMDKITDWYITNTGYVLQLTAPYYEELTVRENILLAALMRLPWNISNRERFKRIEQVITETGLTNLANTVVGGNTGAGLSGGQKRRLCVAIQLLQQPSVLFLDEPTSGLDAAASYELLTHLKHVAESNRTVILTIHQPRPEIFSMFHKILVLCQGQVVYSGVPDNAYKVFSKAQKHTGKKTIKHGSKNPADAIMDMLNSDKCRQAIMKQQTNHSRQTEKVKKAIKAFKKSDDYCDGPKNKEPATKASFFHRYLSWEMRFAQRQSWVMALYLSLVFISYGLLLGTVYLQSPSGTLLLSGFGVFSCASGLFMFPIIMLHLSKSLEIFELEYADGVGGLFDLVIQTFVRFTANSLLPILCSTSILYILAVPYHSYSVWVLLQLLVIHVALNQTWIALLTFVITAIPSFAHRISPVISAIAGFSGGFFVPPSLMPPWYQWLFYVNPNYYGFSAIGHVLLSDMTLECVYDSELECYPTSASYILSTFDLDQITPEHHIISLLIMTFLFLTLSCVVMTVRYSLSNWSFKGLLEWIRKYKNILKSIETEDCEDYQTTSDSDLDGDEKSMPTPSTRMKQQSTMQYLSIDNAEQLSQRSGEVSGDEMSPNNIPKFVIEEIMSTRLPSPSSLAPPDVFVDKFDENNPQQKLSFDLLKVPNKGVSTASLYSSAYMTPCASITSINSNIQTKSTSQERGSLYSLNFDKYLKKIGQRKMRFSRRKSLSESDLTTISVFPMSSLGCSSATQSRRPINKVVAHNSYSYLMLPDECKTARSRFGSVTEV